MNQHGSNKVLLHDVFVSYPHNATRRCVLNHINLHIRAGALVSLVGPTGCGKSTLLRLLLGSEQPTSGQVLVDNASVERPDHRRGIVFQRYSLFPHRTVLENLMFGSELTDFSLVSRYLRWRRYREKRKEYAERALQYLQSIGLAEEDAAKYPHQLSGGMRQRVAIAQALIINPDVLLMDEPFGALDDSTRRVMQEFLIDQWQRKKMTVIFVTHDLGEAVFLGTRIIVLSSFYSTSHPDEDDEGSKIVLDKEIPYPHTREFRDAPEYAQLLHQVRQDGLDPGYRQHITAFDLTHADALPTEK